jgi:hypothetical protein
MSMAKSVILSEMVAKVLLIGAGVALVLGIVGAVAIAIATSGTEGSPTGYAVAQTCGALVSCLLPAGVLAASAAAIRLQISRVEAEYVES